MTSATDRSTSVIRKKLRWYDDCEMKDVNMYGDERDTERLVKKFVSCALCPKCFIHLADLQHHHETFHFDAAGTDRHQHLHHHHSRAAGHQRRLELEENDDVIINVNRQGVDEEEDEDEDDEKVETWHPCSSTVNIEGDNNNTTSTRRSNLKSSRENVGAPSTPSPRPSPKFYRCNVCLELFDTSQKLKAHKTLADHHQNFDKNSWASRSTRDKYRYNAKGLAESFASQKMQCQIESFLAEKKHAKSVHIAVRVVHAAKKSFEVSSFVQNLFNLSSPRIECNAKTIFLFERFGNVDVIVFALFVQEYGDDPAACPAVANRRRIFVSHFGTPGFLQGLNDDLHAELFCQFLLSYLNYATAAGYEQVYFSSRMMANSDHPGDQDDGIFNCKNVIRFRTEWLVSVFNDARTQQQVSYVGNFRTLADYRHFCHDTSEEERRFPLFIFDDDEDAWSARIEKSAVQLLRKRRNEWLELDKSASRDNESRTMADVLMYDLLAGNRFVVVNLQPPGGDKRASEKRSTAFNRQFDIDEEDDFCYLKRPSFLANSSRFLEKCRRKGWQFDTLQQAANSTASIINKICSASKTNNKK